jgi:hypothetical protein
MFVFCKARSLFKEKFGKVDLELSGPTPKRARGKNFALKQPTQTS